MTLSSTSTSPPARLRVAVVGAGYVATHHLAALSRLDFVDLVGLCDSNLDAAHVHLPYQMVLSQSSPALEYFDLVR